MSNKQENVNEVYEEIKDELLTNKLEEETEEKKGLKSWIDDHKKTVGAITIAVLSALGYCVVNMLTNSKNNVETEAVEE